MKARMKKTIKEEEGEKGRRIALEGSEGRHREGEKDKGKESQGS